MPSFSDSIFLFVLALLLFGPKRLPVLARELGKWIGEFRRASNEFKMQMEDELRQSEQAERMKKIEEMEAAAPKAPELEASTSTEVSTASTASEETTPEWGSQTGGEGVETTTGVSSEEPAAETPAVLPIAESGEVKMMPPSTGLPLAREAAHHSDAPQRNALGGLLDSIPAVESEGVKSDAAETVHGN
jgi:sec-independent protein translocase protein TatB